MVIIPTRFSPCRPTTVLESSGWMQATDSSQGIAKLPRFRVSISCREFLRPLGAKALSGFLLYGVPKLPNASPNVLSDPPDALLAQ